MAHADTHIEHHSAEHDLDPHGAQHGHEHVILSWQLLVGILMALFALTALTVFTAQAEVWIMDTWNIEIPRWVNIVGAMSIATVKALLVALFFMQLKYDKPLNGIVMLFCLFCVWLFLMFSMIDLGNRDKILEYKAEVPSLGGSGAGLNTALDTSKSPAIMSSRLSPHIETGGVSLPEYAYNQALAEFEKALAESHHSDGADGEDAEHAEDHDSGGLHIPDHYRNDPFYTENPERAFWHHYYEHTYLDKGKTPHHHERDTNHYYDSFLTRFHTQLAAKGLDAHHSSHESSDSNRSRPTHGLTPGLFSANDAHGSDHGQEHPDAHNDEEHTDEPHAGDDEAAEQDHAEGDDHG